MARFDPAVYDSWYGTAFGSLCHRLERDALFSLAQFRPGETVLDGGCGTGVYLKELRARGAAAVGLDESAPMLEYAAGKGRGPRLVMGSLAMLPFKGPSFDKVLSVCALEFSDDPAAVFAEFARVMKSGGMLLLGFLNKLSPWARLRMDMAKDPGSAWHGVRFYGLGDIGRLAGKLDLRLRGIRGAVYFPPEAEGKDTAELESMEAEGRACCPSTAAFIAASFVKA
jgi:SAM-dependent methyltransferase